MRYKLLGTLFALGLSAAVPLAAQTAVVGFDDGWQGWNGPQPVEGALGSNIEPEGGNPGAHVHTIAGGGSITYWTDSNADFIGDFSGHGQVTIGIDVKVDDISTLGNPVARNLVVEFRSYSLAQELPWTSVWYELALLQTGQDWATYAVTFDPGATELPEGWGGYGAEDPNTGGPILPPDVTFADVMAQTEELAFTTQVPGFFYGFADFNVRIDNIRVVKKAAAAPQYEIVDLGDFGGELANAHGISEAGEVVGTAEAPNLEALPFLWRNGEMTDIGTLIPDAESGHGIARGISNDGRFVTGYSMAPYTGGPGTVSHAFLWSKDTGMIDITPGTIIMSGGWGVNSAGQVVGEVAGQAGGAFLWSQADGMTMISLPGAPAGFSNMAEDISDSGLVCGHQWNVDFDYVGWVYDSTSGDIRELPNLGAARSETRAINEAGDVVGASALPNNQQRPVLWTPDDEIVDLGFLPVPDFSQGIANALNDERWVVGYDSYDGNGVPTKGWLWVGGEKYELRTLIADAGQQAEWEELTTPLDINNNGEIVGIGIRNGVPGRAFLMRPVAGDDVIFAHGFELE